MTDYDGPWKEAFDELFEYFMALFFKTAHKKIDWKRGYEVLDKELQQIAPDAAQGKLYVDKLIKVWLYNGEEAWILIHIEVQTQSNSDFPERMFDYRCRLRIRYRKPVMSIAVLADDRKDWRPNSYRESTFGSTLTLRMATVKLLDWEDRIEELESSTNPFASVVLAHLKTLATRNHADERLRWKIRFIKNLYERGWPSDRVRYLFRLIDWLMDLPREREDDFWNEIKAFEKEKSMPFMTTPERIGEARGETRGEARGLRKSIIIYGKRNMPGFSFQDESALEAIADADQLTTIFNSICGQNDLEVLRRLIAEARAPKQSS